jgi:hypothetical protein
MGATLCYFVGSLCCQDDHRLTLCVLRLLITFLDGLGAIPTMETPLATLNALCHAHILL